MAGTVVICFTDIVESTELLTTLGDEAFDDVPPGRLGRHDRGVWAETRRLVPAATAPYWGQLGAGGDLDELRASCENAVARCDDIESPSFGAIARLELTTALHLRNGPGDGELTAAASSESRRLAEQVGMPGWIERIDRLESGDLEPWRLEHD